jgi:CubicO group peptidase (beta-lactamase class C family)
MGWSAGISRVLKLQANRALTIAGIATCLAALPPATAQKSASELEGVWQAKRNFGPEARGPLLLERHGQEWTATISEFSAAVSIENNGISFELADGQGAFHGSIGQKDEAITGFWTQPPTVFIGNEFLSPVTLKKTGANQWRGEVVPLDDTMTVYLVVKSKPDGGLSAYLRNPERNAGLFLNADRLERQGDELLLEKSDPKTAANTIIARGSYDSVNEVLPFYLPALGGSFDFAHAGADSGFYARGKNAAPYVYREPQAREDGWPVASLDDVGISRPAMENLVRTILAAPDDSVHSPNFHGILIARHGKLVLEEYFHGFSAERPHETRSAAKSMAAILAGAAMYAGAPIDLSTPVFNVLYDGKPPADLDPRKQSITLENLLTMSSGLDCNDGDDTTPGSENNMQSQMKDPDWRHFTMNVPMAREPGSLSLYCAGGSNLVGGVLSKATGKSAQELFDTLVTRPLHCNRYYMNLAPNGDIYLGGGMHFLPRDFMKFAQLMLNGGTWDGRRILARDFVQKAISTETHITDHSHGVRKYGYLFWINDYNYKNRKVEAFFLGGNGGQIVMGIPELDLAMAFYGGSYGDKGTFQAQDDYVPNFILPAVEEGR